MNVAPRLAHRRERSGFCTTERLTRTTSAGPPPRPLRNFRAARCVRQISRQLLIMRPHSSSVFLLPHSELRFSECLRKEEGQTSPRAGNCPDDRRIRKCSMR